MRKRTDDRERRDFVRRLRAALEYAGISQNELARKTKSRSQTVSDWFSKSAMPGGEAMVRIPAALGISGHWLLTGEGSMVPQGEGGMGKAFDMGGRAAFAAMETALSQARESWGSGK